MGEFTDRTETVLMAGGVVALAAALVATQTLLGQGLAAPSPDASLGALLGQGAAPAAPQVESAWIEILKLVYSGMVGMLVTVIHKRHQREHAPSRSFLQAAVLLCVSGALMMIIIGNSTARALGIAGGASIIRFRTPVDDPKDAILLFILMGLGMSLGLGAFAVCGLATAFLCGFLVILERFGERKPKTYMLEVVATSKDFPSEHVDRVLGATVEFYEALKVSQGNEASVRYRVQADPGTSLSYINQRLMDSGKAGLKSVSWDAAKKAEA